MSDDIAITAQIRSRDEHICDFWSDPNADSFGGRDCPDCRRIAYEPLVYAFMRDDRLIIDVVSGYKIKETLKRLGYRFIPSGKAMDACDMGFPRTAKRPSVWRLVHPATQNGRDAHLVELARLEVWKLAHPGDIYRSRSEAALLELTMPDDTENNYDVPTITGEDIAGMDVMP